MAHKPVNKNKYSGSGSYKFKKQSQKPLLFPVHPDNAGKKAYKPKRSFDLNINLRPILFFLALILIIAGIGYLALSRQALAVMVDNEPVGYIKDMNTTEEELNALILAKLKEDVGNNIEINEDISLQKVNSIFKRVSNNAEDVIANVCKAVTYRQEATKILVDGKQACIVTNEDAAKQIFKTILDNYKPNDGTANPEFAAQIKTEAAFVESTDVADIDTAIKLLSQTKQEEKIHTVVKGDTFASIAANAGMTEAELLQANPSISSETKANLSIGQQIKVIITVPTIPIRTYKTTTTTESIPYETEREPDDTMEEGDTEEIQEGVDGEKQVIEKIPYVNGSPQGDPIRSEKVIKEAVPRIIKYGTYEPDYDEDYYDDEDYDEDE